MRDLADRHARKAGLPIAAGRLDQIPLGRAGTPADIWNVVEFLLSDKANYITGQALNVTGGLFMSWFQPNAIF